MAKRQHKIKIFLSIGKISYFCQKIAKVLKNSSFFRAFAVDSIFIR